MSKNIRFFGLLGLLASIMVGIGEFLVHYTPGFLENSKEFAFFLTVPESKLTLGHYLMIPFIPLYIFGYWHIYLALKNGSHFLAKAVLTLGIFAFMIGGIWVGSRAHLGVTMQHLTEAGDLELKQAIINSYNLHQENLVQILRVLILLLSICFIWAIVKGGTLYPKWMAFFNPITLLLLIFASSLVVPRVGEVLIAPAMNVAHFILFTASLLSLSKHRLSS